MLLNEMKNTLSNRQSRDSKEFLNIKRKIDSLEKNINKLSIIDKLKTLEYIANIMQK